MAPGLPEVLPAPVTGHNDYATWAQILVSSGDTTRDATGCDCITEITPQRGQLLKANGYHIVGRYLDEHLAPGDDGYLGKAGSLPRPTPARTQWSMTALQP